ncbi:MAG: hypothetical protein K2W96_15545 [Gemmataceae bacterium]|nr:hypothetical protein [Gemmataceae bacterium]
MLSALILAFGAGPPVAPPPVKLLIAFSSYRERRLHPRIHFYEHDGVGSGKIVGGIDPVAQRSDHQPRLSADGRWCAFSAELENQTSRILLWDRKEKKLVADLPKLNDSPNAQLHPALSGDGSLLAFSAWDRPGVSPRWHVLLYDVPGKKLLDVPGLNKPSEDARMPSISGDGKTLAFVRLKRGASTDLHLHDRAAGKGIDAPPGLNSPKLDIEPSLSRDGNLVAFVSDRAGGKGGRDIHLFDRAKGKLVPLPGLNSAAHEQSPSLSPGGRFIAFVSERTKGEGERDVWLYDRARGRLLPTPGLNSKAEELSPCVTVLEGKE